MRGSDAVSLLDRENLFEEMLQEKEEIAAKRKRCKEILRVLQQAAWVCYSSSGPIHSESVWVI